MIPDIRSNPFHYLSERRLQYTESLQLNWKKCLLCLLRYDRCRRMGHRFVTWYSRSQKKKPRSHILRICKKHFNFVVEKLLENESLYKVKFDNYEVQRAVNFSVYTDGNYLGLKIAEVYIIILRDL